METIAFYKQKEGIRVLRHVGFDDNGDYLFNSLFEDRNPFAVRKVDVSNKYEIIPDFNIDKIERHTCGRRGDSFYPGHDTKNVDYYEELPNGDLVCSFCGSAHWNVFNKVVDHTISKVDGYGIEASTKGYKIYINQPGISNAGEGAIKFYTHHVPFDKLSKEELDNSEAKVGIAIGISRTNFDNRIKAIRENNEI